MMMRNAISAASFRLVVKAIGLAASPASFIANTWLRANRWREEENTWKS